MAAKRISLLLIVLGLAANAAIAATITVRKDGTGDYIRIQPALDAAASGDTVLIGPGEYTTLNPSYIPGYAWDVDVGAYVRVPDLTLIGAGAGLTVIGPTSYQGDSQTFSPKALVWLEGDLRRIEGITFRNCYEGIHAIDGPIFVEGCSFENNGIGVIWKTDESGGHILDSSVETSVGGALSIGMIGSGSGIEISGLVSSGGQVIDIEEATMPNPGKKNLPATLPIFTACASITLRANMNVTELMTVSIT